MVDSMYSTAIELIDQVNMEDPNHEIFEGQSYPKELLYSIRMTQCLNSFGDSPSVALKLATRAQHIGRWKVPRNTFPMDKVGYYAWRNTLKNYHAEITASILEKVGFEATIIGEVSDLLKKKQLKNNPETQTLEDVICFVFLQYYMADFSVKYPEEKMIKIIQKTWKKMSEKGQAKALELDLPASIKPLVEKALS